MPAVDCCCWVRLGREAASVRRTVVAVVVVTVLVLGLTVLIDMSNACTLARDARTNDCNLPGSAAALPQVESRPNVKIVKMSDVEIEFM